MGEADVTLTQTDEKPPDSALVPGEDSVVWSHEVEVCLFHAMIGHKPVGVNRHFHMICIRDKFSQNIGRQVSSSVIWDHLGTMYDMQALHESEILPFPNNEKSFSLPDDIIQEVKEGKLGSEEETKEEFRMEREPPATHEEGTKLFLLLKTVSQFKSSTRNLLSTLRSIKRLKALKTLNYFSTGELYSLATTTHQGRAKINAAEVLFTFIPYHDCT
ncbi:hypothetical protein F2P81_011364 [Scophthalmus maximus]|uniref:MRG-binding protein n=1 Tax=Scophthalmus maximus TaxID=52904 RepID=A0A6A4T1D3_SCOMX|nr:hypothetical protein F2P81_011364 [Scophthalmus maximus]